MKLLITGGCGFVGSSLALYFQEYFPGSTILCIDNLARAGSELNRQRLTKAGIQFIHGDLRCASDLQAVGPVDWLIDCAALPSVLSGLNGTSTSRQLLEHNLVSTLNTLEYCKQHSTGLILLSSSRVYSIAAIADLPLLSKNNAFAIDCEQDLPSGVTSQGIKEDFSTSPPVSLYGSTKLASEILALEYASAFDFPVWINRCGLIAGAGQFARPDQGIFSYWIHCYAQKRKLQYIGFDGSGRQVRDILHPSDLGRLLIKQMQMRTNSSAPKLVNVSGGLASARSLKQVTDWCSQRYGQMKIDVDLRSRPYDLAWIILDSTLAGSTWDWQPSFTPEMIFEEIAADAASNPKWLDTTT